MKLKASVGLVAMSLSFVAAATVMPAAERSLLHDSKCGGCAAEAVWAGFIDHLQKTGHQDLVPPNALPPEDEDELEAWVGPDLIATDPVKGILFKLSPDLVNLDALTAGTDGKPLSEADAVKVRELAARLEAAEDPYLKAYGTLYRARLDLEAKECKGAAAALEGLVKSCYFLPRREARRGLAPAYACLGDDTLSLLELQFFLTEIAPENAADRRWAEEQLKQLRERKHPGPLHHSEESMRKISGLLSDRDVSDGTQSQERRVEDILEKTAQLLERKGGG